MASNGLLPLTPGAASNSFSVSSGSTSTEPVQSSGGDAGTISSSRHSSKSSSSMVPSKYWISMVPSSPSMATISKESPPDRAYH
jgi:hypothetical protein